MPIVTWTRDLPAIADWWYFNQSNGLGPITGSESYHVGSQTTTSWRTTPEHKVRFRKGVSHGSTDDFVRGSAQREADYDQMSGPEILGNLRNENRQINGDIGNEFYTKKVEYLLPNRKVKAGYRPPSSDHDYVSYIGPLSSYYAAALPTALPSSMQIEMDGTACVRATVPTRQQAALGTFLLELRERLPHLYGTTLLRSGVGAKQIGDEYLNSKFGIDPLISDVKKIGHSILNFNKLIKDFQKKSGTVVHRRYTLYDTSSQPYPNATGIPASIYMSRPNNQELLPQLYDYVGLCDISYTGKSSCKFSGAYTYYLEQGHSYLAKMEYWAELADYLLGADINASSIWELTPWSWLADWFGNTGSFLSNVSALNQDALVMKYGYVMHSVEYITSVTTFGMRTKDPSYWGLGYYGPSTFTDISVASEKRRTRATPYGFGVDLGSLSPQRWAILSALGMTKAPNKLRLRS